MSKLQVDWLRGPCLEICKEWIDSGHGLFLGWLKKKNKPATRNNGWLFDVIRPGRS